jgi:hypothetical protein
MTRDELPEGCATDDQLQKFSLPSNATRVGNVDCVPLYWMSQAHDRIHHEVSRRREAEAQMATSAGAIHKLGEIIERKDREISALNESKEAFRNNWKGRVRG